MTSMQILQLINGTMTREGAGVKLYRFIGADPRNLFDPFLLLDEFNSDDPMDYIGGFPAHPHRGFETITYLLAGQIAHEDNHGHHGLITAGDVQWMTAGRGIIHSEMPQQTSERLWGIQLWLNLPAESKWVEPRYQEYKAVQLPLEQQENGVVVKVIAGETANKTASPIHGIVTQPLFFELSIPAGQQFRQQIPQTHQSILLVLSGAIKVVSEQDTQSVEQGQLASLSQDDWLIIEGEHMHNRCLLIAAKKINEPIERLGPFVMNTREEILQAIEDFRNNQF